MSPVAKIKLAFTGSEADQHQIDFYDVAQALIGFQRSLALTTHLLLNNKIITHAPALKGASIRVSPPIAGSWEIMALISLTSAGAYKLGTTPKDTPIGHLVYSAYDYVINAILGFNVDYDKSLGQVYEQLKSQQVSVPILPPDRFDTLMEKCEVAVKEMHRPIVWEETASSAHIFAIVGEQLVEIGQPLSQATYEHIEFTVRSELAYVIRGRVSGYYSNPFKGRVFLSEHGRQVPFELMENARGKATLALITESLTANTLYPTNRELGYLTFHAHFLTSKAGTLKRLHVTSVSRA